MVTASEAREPDAFRDSSNRLLERTRLRSILHRVKSLEVFVLSPEPRVIGNGRRVDDAIGEREAIRGPEFCCFDRQVLVQINHRALAHGGGSLKCWLSPLFSKDVAVDFEDGHRRYEK